MSSHLHTSHPLTYRLDSYFATLNEGPQAVSCIEGTHESKQDHETIVDNTHDAW